MANLNEIKKKIGSVKKTRQITKAMQLVAASKMRQFQSKAVNTRAFSWELLDMLKSNLSNPKASIYMEHRKKGKKLFVLYTSDKGLCGALNSQLMRALFSSNIWSETAESDRLLIAIGKKATSYCKYNHIPVEHSYIGLPEDMTPFDALEFIHGILDHWKNPDIQQVIMVAPHYKNSFTFYPVVKTYLPFTEDMLKEHLGVREDVEVESLFGKTGNNFMYFEPSEDRLIATLIEQVIQTLFLQSFYELKASEYSSRMIAMQNATDNADSVIKELTLNFNKARQSAITQQLAELAGGMAAV